MQRKLLERVASVKHGTVEFEVPGDVEPQALGVVSDDTCNTVVGNEPLDATDLRYIPLQIVMLIVGTRGDVQPFIAIGKCLQVSRNAYYLFSAFHSEHYCEQVFECFDLQI